MYTFNLGFIAAAMYFGVIGLLCYLEIYYVAGFMVVWWLYNLYYVDHSKHMYEDDKGIIIIRKLCLALKKDLEEAMRDDGVVNVDNINDSKVIEALNEMLRFIEE
jgi:hypothetical protein